VMWQRNSCLRGMGCCQWLVKGSGASLSSAGTVLALRQRGTMYGGHKWATRILTHF